MKKPLWTPRAERVEKANVTAFIDLVNDRHGLGIGTYGELYKWSIENIEKFWADFWDFARIKASGYEKIVDDLKKFPGAGWFRGSRLNFAENLLRFRDGHAAVISTNEAGDEAVLSYEGLYRKAASIAAPLRRMGILPGDRVGAYMPNIVETAACMLAAASTGAVWSSCGTELGPGVVVSRLGQTGPRVLFTVDGCVYKGKTFDMLPAIERIAREIPTLERVVVLPCVQERPDISRIPGAVMYNDFIDTGEPGEIPFEQLPFDHPLYIMFSSGTTGPPKCMVQGAGGILINHLKELMLHTDLRRTDRILYITSPSWMMWNWLIGSLAVGATVVLYDGNPAYPDWRTMWRLAEDAGITVFGCGASYIEHLKKTGARPGAEFGLSKLREISQTGSPLSKEGFEYVYREIKGDVHLNSISGGTDINGCFAAGSPIQPVYAGELQGPALAMKIKAYDEAGIAVNDREGELVCEAPSPSMPLYFWNDPDGSRYKDAYFAAYPGVWRHGDWIEMHGDTGGITFLGRSDYTLNPSGVRIGSAEIYSVVEAVEGVADSIAAGQEWEGDERIVLFVKPESGFALTDKLKSEIRERLRREASPRHIPALIMEAPDVPYTFSMKKVESAVTNIINGRPVANRDALINPGSLDYYEDYYEAVSRKLREGQEDQ